MKNIHGQAPNTGPKVVEVNKKNEGSDKESSDEDSQEDDTSFVFLGVTFVCTIVFSKKKINKHIYSYVHTNIYKSNISTYKQNHHIFLVIIDREEVVEDIRPEVGSEIVNVEDLAQGSGTSRPRRKIRSPERYGDFVYK
jgi:hypothetical protein